MAQRHTTPTDGDPTAEELSEETTSKGGKTFLVIALATLLVALGAGVSFAYFFYPQARAAASVVGLSGEAAEAEEEPIEYGEFLEFQGLIINPSDSDGRRYLMVNIGLESNNEKVLDEVSSKEIVIRDRILDILGKRTVSELSNIAMRDSLKSELLTAVNSVVTSEDDVARLYFTQYVLQ